MFENIVPPPADKILQISQEFAADDRAEKIDLGVGVYKDEAGQTTIMPSVLKGEEVVAEKQTTKTYMGMLGDKEFSRLMANLVLADSVDMDRLAMIQTPGGSGALRVLMDYLKLASPDAVLHVPDPTWANHVPIAAKAGLKCDTYGYFNRDTKLVEFSLMEESLSRLGKNDIVLLHGCCHNPTGADLSPEQWDRVAELARDKGFVPFVDLAYLGFGDGLEADAHGVRKLVSTVDEMVVAASCSKNFSIYRERTGCGFVLAKDQTQRDIAQASLGSLARTNYSMPPDHGSAIVREILSDPALKSQWQKELDEIRLRINSIRQELASEFRRKTNSGRFDFIAEHRGMFTVLGLSPESVARLKSDHAIYMVGDSRINIAGLKLDDIPRFVDAVLAAGQ